MKKITLTKCKLKTRMRELWEDHVGWTRNVIFCLVDDLPGTEQALNRLLQNQVDIGDAIKPFYGEEGGNALTKLLKEHIMIAGEVINAAKGGNESIRKDILKGGKADGMTLEDIARIHNVTLEQIETQLKLGIKIEFEHTDSKNIAREIAMDHLVEIPDYYDRLIRMEEEANDGKTMDENSENTEDETKKHNISLEALDIANKKWRKNADEIAMFLFKVNPHLKLKDIKQMMRLHLKLTTDEVVARIKKDYDADIIAVDRAHEQIRLMSDMLYMAIVKQFPNKF